MKISNDTLSILKNFSTIEKAILLTPGNIIRTKTPAVYAEAVIAEEFPIEVGIYDLNQFLNVIGLFRDPEFDFLEEYLRIAESDGKAETHYAYAGAGLCPSSKKGKMNKLPNEVIEFALTEDQWATIQKACNVFQKTEIKITSDGKIIRMGTANHKQAHDAGYSTVLEGDTHGFKCNMVFDRSHLQLMKGSYSGTVTKNFTVYKNTSYDLTYYVGTEPTTSTFGDE